MKYSYYRHKDSWEQSRLISFLVAQSNSTKKLQLTDIIKFQWEKEEEENKKKSESTVTNEELEQMMREADKIRKIKFG